VDQVARRAVGPLLCSPPPCDSARAAPPPHSACDGRSRRQHRRSLRFAPPARRPAGYPRQAAPATCRQRPVFPPLGSLASCAGMGPSTPHRLTWPSAPLGARMRVCGASSSVAPANEMGMRAPGHSARDPAQARTRRRCLRPRTQCQGLALCSALAHRTHRGIPMARLLQKPRAEPTRDRCQPPAPGRLGVRSDRGPGPHARPRAGRAGYGAAPPVRAPAPPVRCGDRLRPGRRAAYCWANRWARCASMAWARPSASTSRAAASVVRRRPSASCRSWRASSALTSPRRSNSGRTDKPWTRSVKSTTPKVSVSSRSRWGNDTARYPVMAGE
jgi:hypothetical protein